MARGELASVREIDCLLQAAASLGAVADGSGQAGQEALSEAQSIVDETQQEQQTSQQMLEEARTAEQAAQAALMAAKAGLAVAMAEEAAAIASGNPIAIASAMQQAYEAKQMCDAAKQVYDLACHHRELMEQRCEMAEVAVNMAGMMHAKLLETVIRHQAHIMSVSEEGITRLQAAHDDLTAYHAEAAPEAIEAFQKWQSYEPPVGAPVKPPEIKARLNLSKEQRRALLAYLYAADAKWRELVDHHREAAGSPEQREKIKKQIKRNMAGYLAEEIVKKALSPYFERVDTQRWEEVEGGCTKVDLVLEKAKVPLIFGRGKGMGLREGGSAAVEVKTGSQKYLRSQKEHIIFQAQGHQEYDVSVTICARNIKDMPTDVETEMREEVKEAGSVLLGMLPTKAELDESCLDFVFGSG